jgi:hypothetical protein
MKTQSLVTGALLLFVAVSVGVVIGRTTSRSGEGKAARVEAAGASPAVVAVYYHGTARCLTCNAIESLASEAIRSGFAEEIEKGRLGWEARNFEEPEHEHAFETFGLYSSSLVLIAPGKAGPDSFRVLGDVWGLTGDEEAFASYVREEVSRFLELHEG